MSEQDFAAFTGLQPIVYLIEDIKPTKKEREKMTLQGNYDIMKNYESVLKDTSLFLTLLNTAVEVSMPEMGFDLEIKYADKDAFDTDLLAHPLETTIHFTDVEDGVEHVVTGAVFMYNLIKHWGKLVPDKWVEDHDAEDASYWFQIGMFGEYVYG